MVVIGEQASCRFDQLRFGVRRPRAARATSSTAVMKVVQWWTLVESTSPRRGPYRFGTHLANGNSVTCLEPSEQSPFERVRRTS